VLLLRRQKGKYKTMEERVEDCLRDSVWFGRKQHSLEAIASSCRGAFRGRKLLQKPRRFCLNSLQVVSVVNANDVAEIFALSDVRRTF